MGLPGLVILAAFLPEDGVPCMSEATAADWACRLASCGAAGDSLGHDSSCLFVGSLLCQVLRND